MKLQDVLLIIASYENPEVIVRVIADFMRMGMELRNTIMFIAGTIEDQSRRNK